MNKLMQMMVLIDCLFELGKLKYKSNAAHRVTEIVNFMVEGLLLIVLLGYGICKGIVHIPTYLGDGYSYDNFERDPWEVPEFNYLLGVDYDQLQN